MLEIINLADENGSSLVFDNGINQLREINLITEQSGLPIRSVKMVKVLTLGNSLLLQISLLILSDERKLYYGIAIDDPNSDLPVECLCYEIDIPEPLADFTVFENYYRPFYLQELSFRDVNMEDKLRMYFLNIPDLTIDRLIQNMESDPIITIFEQILIIKTLSDRCYFLRYNILHHREVFQYSNYYETDLDVDVSQFFRTPSTREYATDFLSLNSENRLVHIRMTKWDYQKHHLPIPLTIKIEILEGIPAVYRLSKDSLISLDEHRLYLIGYQSLYLSINPLRNARLTIGGDLSFDFGTGYNLTISKTAITGVEKDEKFNNSKSYQQHVTLMLDGNLRVSYFSDNEAGIVIRLANIADFRLSSRYSLLFVTSSNNTGGFFSIKINDSINAVDKYLVTSEIAGNYTFLFPKANTKRFLKTKRAIDY